MPTTTYRGASTLSRPSGTYVIMAQNPFALTHLFSIAKHRIAIQKFAFGFNNADDNSPQRINVIKAIRYACYHDIERFRTDAPSVPLRNIGFQSIKSLLDLVMSTTTHHGAPTLAKSSGTHVIMT